MTTITFRDYAFALCFCLIGAAAFLMAVQSEAVRDVMLGLAGVIAVIGGKR